MACVRLADSASVTDLIAWLALAVANESHGDRVAQRCSVSSARSAARAARSAWISDQVLCGASRAALIT
jgi:hypothetical protein